MTIEELEAKLETVSRERDKFQALAELGEGYRRERDVACDDLAFILAEYANERNEELTEDALCFKIAGLTHQRDDARTQLAMVEAWHKQMCLSSERGWAQEAERTRERDEARAEVEAMRKTIMHAFPVFTESDEDECTWNECIEAAVQNLRELRRERNEAIDGMANAYRRGAEAMREACAATIHKGGLVWTRESAERALREIGILEEP